MPYKPNPEARGVSHKTDREGLDPFSCVRNDVKKLRCSTTRNGRFLYEPGR
jgi:hypothetical protein